MKYFIPFCFFVMTVSIIQCADNEDRNQNPDKNNDNPEITSGFEGFYFVARYNGKEAVYFYNADDKTSKVFWTDKREDVIELSYSPDKNVIFFLTARNYGKKGALPFVRKSKLYRLDPKTKNTEFLKETGSGIQIYTSWETDNNFKIIINSVDPVIATYINQNTLLLNQFGKTLKDEIKIFDLTREGYPKLPAPEIALTSPEGNFTFVRSQKDSALIQIRGKDGRLIPVIKTFQNINKILWTEEDSLMIFTTLDLPEELKSVKAGKTETSNLVIFSVLDTSVVKIWRGDGLKRFLLFDKMLVFDDGFGVNSVIRIFDLTKRIVSDEIRIKGGCGLKNIPKLIF
ncbi:MAG: hypothetical protein Kow0098_07250 [Ignavibacteriaceae bacterium]